ncbi:iron(III) transport system substrate-binding protein [Devosia enhydra]|uniref:Iron(III) transport system substrate-binding protein n=1 Tax=Devosia enhydra TaxID=665118 RepID=A0A1K2HSN0_9HYPH|nr:extracellular solute-binding protein [Devosia enhydra]SFZ80724.1 iron(III) transport system substrate-binding protein [Devosia enhydra]
MTSRLLTTTALAAFAALAAAPALAQSGSLQIYSAYPDEHMRPLIEAFNKVHPGVTVEVSVQPGEELLSTIELEMRANSPRADVVGLNEASINALQSRHTAFEAYTPAGLDGVREALRDAENLVIPACVNPYLIQYNTNQIAAADAPKSWADLTDAKYKDKVAMADPASSQSVHSFLWFETQYLPAQNVAGSGWEFFSALAANGTRLEGSHGTIRDLTASGERPIGIQLLANGQTSARRGDPTALVWPPEGSPGEISAFAMFAGSDNKEAAQAWLDFVVSVEGQSVMPDALGCAPVRNDVTYTLPGGTPLDQINIVPVDSAFVTANREAQTAEFAKAFGR